MTFIALFSHLLYICRLICCLQCIDEMAAMNIAKNSNEANDQNASQIVDSFAEKSDFNFSFNGFTESSEELAVNV